MFYYFFLLIDGRWLYLEMRLLQQSPLLKPMLYCHVSLHLCSIKLFHPDRVELGTTNGNVRIFFNARYRYKKKKCGFRGETAGSVVIEWWRRSRRYNARCQHRRRSRSSRRYLAGGARNAGHDRSRRLINVCRGRRFRRRLGHRFGHRHGHHRGHRGRCSQDRRLAATVAAATGDVHRRRSNAGGRGPGLGPGRRDNLPGGRYVVVRGGERVAPATPVLRTHQGGPGPAVVFVVSRGEPSPVRHRRRRPFR